MKKYTIIAVLAILTFASCEKDWDGLREYHTVIVATKPGTNGKVPYRHLGSSITAHDGDAFNETGFILSPGDTVSMTREKAALARAKRWKDVITGLGPTP